MQFKEVHTVHAGEGVTSSDHNDLALAFNQRILSGAGDAAWRIIWNAHSLMRQVRNPAGDMLAPGTQQWPASDEWWKMYALVDNTNRCGVTNDAWYWPTTAPGSEEGANVNNPMMAFVFGRDYNDDGIRDVEPEVNRLTDGSDDPDASFEPIDVAVLSGNPSSDAVSAWISAKQQRGVIEEASPYRANAPAYEAARSAYDWRYPAGAPYLKTYTTFAPVAHSEGSCPRFGDVNPVKWTAVFSPLVPGYPRLTFPTCPGVSGHLQSIQRTSDRYILYFQDSGIMMLPYNIYLEGPYDGGGALAKQHSEILTQALNKFVVEMRGSYLERKDTLCYHVEDKGFDFQRFLSNQYALAPASGGVYNEETEELDSLPYPAFRLTFDAEGEEQTLPVGTTFNLTAPRDNDTLQKRYIAPNFVFSALLLTASGTVSTTQVELVDEYGQVISTTTPADPCKPADAGSEYLSVPSTVDTGNSRIVFLSTPRNPVSLRVRLKTPVTLKRGGFIEVEILEQIAYTPDIQDAYAVLRCGLTNGDDEMPDDVGGVIMGEKLKSFSDLYFKYGCIFNINGRPNISQHMMGVNFNAIYESARQMIHENMRMVPRTEIRAYGLEDGKSVLHFNRNGRKGQSGGTEIVEDEIQPVVASQPVDVVQTTDLRERVEYIVRKKGLDNIKPVSAPNPTLQQRVEMTLKLPVESYRENNQVFCDDYVLYGNVKYVPPGYNLAFPPDLTTDVPSDTNNNHDHVIVGMPIPSYAPEEQVPAGYIKLTDGADVQVYHKNDSSRERSYVDGLGQVRTEVVQAAKVYWRSATRLGHAASVDGNSMPLTYTTAWENLVLHRSTRQNDDVRPEDSTGFRYNNGFRYAVQRRTRATSGDAWSAWTIVADGPSGDPNVARSYGFDAIGDAAAGTGAGVFFFEDRQSYGKVLGDTVDYRIVAKPVLDVNHDKMVVYQRAYFSPRQVNWTGLPGHRYVVKRRQQKRGESAVYSVISQVIANDRTSQVFIDLPSTICPVCIPSNKLANFDGYETCDQILSYHVYDVTSTETELTSGVSVSLPTCVVRPDNISPTETGHLLGLGDDALLDVNGNPLTGFTPFVSAVHTVRYKVYGPVSGSDTSAIRFDAPYYDEDGENRQVQTVEVRPGNQFNWLLSPVTSAPPDGLLDLPCGNAERPDCVNPWIPSLRNFTNLRKVWATESNTEDTSLLRQQAYIYQYARYIGGDYAVIENTAGAEPGHFTGVFAFQPSLTGQTLSSFRRMVTANESWYTGDADITSNFIRYNTPAEFSAGTWFYDVTQYVETLKPTQWTPWSSGPEKGAATIDANTCTFYVLRTGYERLHLEFWFAPGPGTYTVRGLGYITYKGQKYHSGDLVTFTSDDLSFTASDSSMKLVVTTTVSCNSLSFDHFAGIAPDKNLAEADLFIGVTYKVYRGKGIKYQKKTEEGFAETTVNPGSTFVWGDGDTGIAYVPGVEQSQIRAVDGITHRNEVAKRGQSNEWCMFMSFNHYHPSISSIWKTDAYGDVMPFLHNRCHTYSYEIRRPAHGTLSSEFAYGQFPPLISEAPPGYTYLEDINFPWWPDRNAAKDYFRSCQIYRQPYEIEAAEIVYTPVPDQTDSDGNQLYNDDIVKITLKGRLQHHRAAPANPSSSLDPASEARIAALRAETYRTDENGIREYLLSQATGMNCVKGMLGDSATSYNIFTLPDDPMGACHPRFYFVKLVPYAYEDGNSTVENKSDSLIKVDPYLQMDLYLRAMCGGWMDISSLRDVNCDQGLSSSPVGDYLYENLCFQACRSYGAHLDVTPDVVTGLSFLPHQTMAQYDFTFPPEYDGVPLVMEFRNWEIDKCAFSAWTPLQGSIMPGAPETGIGGEGYGVPPILVVEPGESNRFRYVKLASPVTLTEGTEYYLVSSELSGGDQWYDKVKTEGMTTSTVVQNVKGITDVMPAKYVGGTWTEYNGEGDRSAVFGPVTFRSQCVGCPQGAAVVGADRTGNAVNGTTGKFGMKFTPVSDVTVYELGRMQVPGNTGTHLLEIIDATTFAVVASATLDMAPGVADPGDPDTYLAPVLLPVITNGVITDVTIANPGSGLDPAALSKIRVIPSSTSGGGAVLSVGSLTPEGGIATVTISNGGSGYSSPVIVTFINESFMNPGAGMHLSAQAVARVGAYKLDRIEVDSVGNGYSTASVVISGGGGAGASGTVSINESTGQIIEVQLNDPGAGYTSAPTVTITGNGTGALARAVLAPTGTPIGPVASIDVVEQGWGYASPPDVQITGGDAGDGRAFGARAVARMEVLNMEDDSGLKVVGVDLVLEPNSNLTSITIPFNGPTSTKTEFRFTLLSDWPDGVRNPDAEVISGITVTPSNHLSFSFLPDEPPVNPHKYQILRNDHKYGDGCNLTPGEWLELTGDGGEAGPVCENNSNHRQYDGCTIQCSCPWPDPNNVPDNNNLLPISDPPVADDVIGSSYRINDLSATSGTGQVLSVGVVSQGSGYSTDTQVYILGGGGFDAAATPTVSGGHVTTITVTNPGSHYTGTPRVVIFDPNGTGSGATAAIVVNARVESYFMSWPMQPGAVYNVERQMFYRYNSGSEWQVVAEGVRAPYIDRADWDEYFTRKIPVEPVYTYKVIGSPQVFVGEATARNVNFSADETNRNVYIDCVVTVTVPLDTGSVEVDFPVDEIKIWVEDPAAGSLNDGRVFEQWTGRILRYTYTVRQVEKVTIGWNALPNHALLVAEKERSGIIYELHRKFESIADGGGSTGVDEVIARSVAYGAATSPDFALDADSTTESIDWTGWDDEDHKRLDDRRNNAAFAGGTFRNTEEYYVLATWHDWPEIKCVKDVQQNREACTPIDGDLPCVNMNRQYRVEAVVNARTRWFTSMPMAINSNRPQGFGPVPNTCTYAEMFNNYANAINLLRYARLELPFTKKMRTVYSSSIPPEWWATATNCNSMGCSSSGSRTGTCGGNAGYVTYSDWTDVLISGGAGASASVGPIGFAVDDDCSEMQMGTFRNDTQFAVDPDQECFAAIPTPLMANFNISGMAVIAKQSDSTGNCSIRKGLAQSCAASSCCRVGTGSGSCGDSQCTCSDVENPGPEDLYTAGCCSCGCRLRDENGAYMRNECRTISQSPEKCVMFLEGTISAPGLPCGDASWIGGGGFTCMTGAAWSTRNLTGIRTLVYLTFPLY